MLWFLFASIDIIWLLLYSTRSTIQLSHKQTSKYQLCISIFCCEAFGKLLLTWSTCITTLRLYISHRYMYCAVCSKLRQYYSRLFFYRQLLGRELRNDKKMKFFVFCFAVLASLLLVIACARPATADPAGCQGKGSICKLGSTSPFFGCCSEYRCVTYRGVFGNCG